MVELTFLANNLLKCLLSYSEKQDPGDLKEAFDSAKQMNGLSMFLGNEFFTKELLETLTICDYFSFYLGVENRVDKAYLFEELHSKTIVYAIYKIFARKPDLVLEIPAMAQGLQNAKEKSEYLKKAEALLAAKYGTLEDFLLENAFLGTAYLVNRTWPQFYKPERVSLEIFSVANEYSAKCPEAERFAKLARELCPHLKVVQ